MWVSLNPKSSNKKVGPIPVSTTEEESCPAECPLKGTDCYARFGPLGMHWNKVSGGQRGDNWDAFCHRVSQFPAKQKWRHNQAGDLPQNSKGKIHKTKLRKLLNASVHTRGWTYTHYCPLDKHNQEAIKEANETGGMTVNLSADSLSQADEYSELNIAPVTTILPRDAELRGNKTPNGLPIVVCPAQLSEQVTCEDCMLCEKADRKSIVGFLAHGTASKRLSEKLENES